MQLDIIAVMLFIFCRITINPFHGMRLIVGDPSIEKRYGIPGEKQKVSLCKKMAYCIMVVMAPELALATQSNQLLCNFASLRKRWRRRSQDNLYLADDITACL